jgi:hypothetical protein
VNMKLQVLGATTADPRSFCAGSNGQSGMLLKVGHTVGITRASGCKRILDVPRQRSCRVAHTVRLRMITRTLTSV